MQKKKNHEDLEGQLSTVKRFSDDIRMHFGLDKCESHIKGKFSKVKFKNITLDINTKISVRIQ